MIKQIIEFASIANAVLLIFSVVSYLGIAELIINATIEQILIHSIIFVTFYLFRVTGLYLIIPRGL